MLWTIFVCLTAAFAGYAAAAIGDYMIHRYIWHGRWGFVHRGPLRWWLEPHYVHHWEAHHRHAQDFKAELMRAEPVPRAAHLAVEAEYADDPWTVWSLQCSKHGITINSVMCVVNYYTLFLLTPVPWVVAAVWLIAGPVPAICALVPSFTAIFTQISHRYYHMHRSHHVAEAPAGLRWFFGSREFRRMTAEHLQHHYNPRCADRYYSVLPFARYFIWPVFRTW